MTVAIHAGWHSTPLTLFLRVKKVLMQLSVIEMLSVLTPKAIRHVHPKGIGNVASRQGCLSGSLQRGVP